MLLKCNPRNATGKNRLSVPLFRFPLLLRKSTHKPSELQSMWANEAQDLQFVSWMCLTLHFLGGEVKLPPIQLERERERGRDTLEMPLGGPCLYLVCGCPMKQLIGHGLNPSSLLSVHCLFLFLCLHLCWLSCRWSVFSLRYWPGAQSRVDSVRAVASIQEVCLRPCCQIRTYAMWIASSSL